MKKINCILSILCIFLLNSCSGIYTFTYHTNSDSSFETITKEKSELESYELPTLSKDGYTFDSWYLDSTFEAKYDDFLKKIIEVRIS